MFKLEAIKLITLCLTMVAAQVPSYMDEVIAWTMPEYEWPSEEYHRKATQDGSYIFENNMPVAIDRWNNKLFVTVPRWKTGVASTLNYVDLNKLKVNRSPKLTPYPDWETNTLPADGEPVSDKLIIDTFRVRVDKCDRLWVVDSGHTNVINNPRFYLPPALLIYDLKTDKLLRRHVFSESDLRENSFLANIIVNSDEKDCENAFGYIADPNAWGLIMYSFKDDDSWRVSHQYFYFEPLECNLKINGVEFQWMDGLFGLTLSKKHSDGSRTLYFHPTCSTKQFEVSTKILQNKTASTSPTKYHDFHFVGNRGNNTQSTTCAMDQNSEVILYTQILKAGIACWNTNTKLSPETFHLIFADKKLGYVNEVMIDREEKYFWVLTNLMIDFLYGSVNTTNINVQLFRTPVKSFVDRSPCKN